MQNNNKNILTISCPDKIGIVSKVSTLLADNGVNIINSAQYGDSETGLFFMRVHLELAPSVCDHEELKQRFASLAQSFSMQWTLYKEGAKTRTLIMVSRYGHCLNDLLYRSRAGMLNADVCAVVSNHSDLKELVGCQNIPFHVLPITKDNKAEQEAALFELIEKEQIELVVLARYMQILSENFCNKLQGRCINIHHSFLPSFKGASPYQQAYNRGVKLIGATAHYVTSNLDEGPIIEQSVERVDHSYNPKELEELGRGVECTVLAKAINYHVEHRVLLNGNKTVILR